MLSDDEQQKIKPNMIDRSSTNNYAVGYIPVHSFREYRVEVFL